LGVMNICGEVSYNDPDKNFEILDDVSVGNNSKSFKQSTTPLLSSAHRWGAVLPFDCIDQHNNDSAKSLQFIAKWVNDISESNHEEINDEESDDNITRDNKNNISKKQS
ncbi:15542_t:CDS:2, partial [Racocetra persica]